MRFGTLVWKNLARRPSRTLLNLTALSAAVAAVVSLLGISQGFTKSFAGVYEAHSVDIVVSRQGAADRLSSSVDAGIVEKVRSVAGVARADGVLLETLSLEELGVYGIPTMGIAPGSWLLDDYKITQTSPTPQTSSKTSLGVTPLSLAHSPGVTALWNGSLGVTAHSLGVTAYSLGVALDLFKREAAKTADLEQPRKAGQLTKPWWFTLPFLGTVCVGSQHLGVSRLGSQQVQSEKGWSGSEQLTNEGLLTTGVTALPFAANSFGVTANRPFGVTANRPRARAEGAGAGAEQRIGRPEPKSMLRPVKFVADANAQSETLSGQNDSAEQSSRASVMLGIHLAERISAKPGDVISFFDEPYTVSGIFQSTSTWENGSMIFPLQKLQELTDRKGQLTYINVVLESGFDAQEQTRVVNAIEQLDQKLLALPTQEFVDSDTRMQIAKAMAWMTSIVAIVVGSIGTLNTMLTSVLERTKEIGILRAIGWPRKRVFHMIVMESLLMAAVASVIGMVVALLLTRLLSQSSAAKGILSPEIDATTLLTGGAIAIAVGLVGALLPAWRATRMLPTEAFREGG